MDIVDSQLHAWLPHSRKYPWAQSERAQALHDEPVPAESLRSMMRAVGVTAALLTSPAQYGGDHSYAFDCAARYPEVFGVVGPVKPGGADVAEYVRTFRHKAGGIAIRLPPSNGLSPTDPAYDAILRAARDGDVPVFLGAPGWLPQAREVALRHSEVLFVLDHLGHPASGRRLDDLDNLVALADCRNVVLKCVDAPRFSRHTYPFPDIWPMLDQIIGAFSPKRLLWGSDITRVDSYTYADAVGYMLHTDHLGAGEKRDILGGNLRRLLRWPVLS